MTNSAPVANRGLTAQYSTLIAALLGWMFDGFEMGLFPLIGRPALEDLLRTTANDKAAAQWFGVIMAVFLVGAASGGVLFGWLGDKIGRVRAMSLSILTYAVFTGMCGWASAAWQIAVLRFIASLGMGGEWSLGVALVNEIWPGKSRAFIAGLIGAAANVGFLMVALLSIWMTEVVTELQALLSAVGLSAEMVDELTRNKAWRFLMISGALPALLIFFIRIFVPESSRWEEEHASGKTSNWNNSDLLGVLAGCASAVCIIVVWSPLGDHYLHWVLSAGITIAGLAGAVGGFLYPVRQYLRRAEADGQVTEFERTQVIQRMLLGAGLAGVALLGTWGSIQWAPRWAATLPQADPQAFISKHAAAFTQLATACGAILSTILAAVAADRFGRRLTYALLCGASFASAVYFYRWHAVFDTNFLFAAFLAGGITAAFYGFFPLYFPELFPTSVRATGQGFSFNFGRILAAVGGLQTANLMAVFENDFSRAGSILATIYLIGLVVICFGPETKSEAAAN
ncbi:MAG: MFS transporter [Planctomycetaceae bacterium]